MRLFIKYLTLENFKPIREKVELNFSDNVSASFIQGENGFGKSTVMEAIALCLDNFKKGKTYGDFVNWKAVEDKEDCKIHLVTDVNNSDLVIDIVINSNGDLNRKATYQNESYEGTQVLGLLERLGIKDFSKIMFYLQGTPDITGKSPTELAEQLQKLFDYNLDSYLEQFDTKNHEERRNQVDKEIYSLKNKTYIKQTFREQKHSKEEYLKAKEDALKAKEAQINIKDQQLEIRKLNNSKSDYQNAIIQLNSEKSENSEKIKKVEIYKVQKEDYDKKKAEADKVTEEALKAYNEVKAKEIPEEEFTKLERQLETLQNHYKYQKFETDFKTAKENKEVFEKEMENLKKEDSMMVESIRVLKAVKAGVCPTCHQPTLDLCGLEEYKYLKEYTDRGLEQLSQDYIDHKEKLTRMEHLLLEANSTYKVCESELNNLKDFEKIGPELEKKTAGEIKEELDALTAEDKKIKAEIEEKRTAYSRAEGLSSSLNAPLIPRFNIEEVNKKLEEINSKIAENELKIKEIETELSTRPSQEELDEQLKLFDTNTLDSIISDYESTENYNVGVEEFNKNLELEEKNDKLKIEEFEKELNDLANQIQKCTEANRLIGKDLLNYITVKTCKKLEIELNNFFNIIFPDMSIELKQKGKGVQFAYGLKSLKTKSDISNTSGFEKQLLSIAWKVALSKAYGIPILFLDEADAYSSEGNSVILYQKLITSGLFDQIFVVSQSTALYNNLIQNFDLELFKVVSKGCIEKVTE